MPTAKIGDDKREFDDLSIPPPQYREPRVCVCHLRHIHNVPCRQWHRLNGRVSTGQPRQTDRSPTSLSLAIACDGSSLTIGRRIGDGFYRFAICHRTKWRPCVSQAARSWEGTIEEKARVGQAKGSAWSGEDEGRLAFSRDKDDKRTSPARRNRRGG